MAPVIKVGIAFRVSDEVIARIEAVDPRIEVVRLFALTHPRSTPEERADALARVGHVEVLLGPAQVPAEALRSAANLRWFQIVNAGADRLHADGFLRQGFVVTNVSGLTSVSIAEYVIGGMIAFAKNMHTAIRNQREHQWVRAGAVGEINGATCGIVGLGAIGRETARRARAMGMRVIACRRTVQAGASDPDCDELFSYDDLGPLLEQSDYLVLAVPLTPETTNMIGAAEFARMKPSACLVNIARGQVVNQRALISALKDDTIAGAVLDVTDPEPLDTESELWDLPNVIITPHMSGAIQGYGHRSSEMFVANLEHYVNGEPLDNVVDPVLGY